MLSLFDRHPVQSFHAHQNAGNLNRCPYLSSYDLTPQSRSTTDTLYAITQPLQRKP